MTLPIARARRPSRRAFDEAGAGRTRRGRSCRVGPKSAPGSAVAETENSRSGFRPVDVGPAPEVAALNSMSSNFCCPDYILLMSQTASAKPGTTKLKSKGQRDYQVHDSAQRHVPRRYGVQKSSGYTDARHNALRAVLTARSPPLPAGFTESDAWCSPNFQVPNDDAPICSQQRPIAILGSLAAGSLSGPAAAGSRRLPSSQRRSARPSAAAIRGRRRASPCPSFIALSADAETLEAAKPSRSVLWDDLNFEREYAPDPARTSSTTVPRHKTMLDVPFDRGAS